MFPIKGDHRQTGMLINPVTPEEAAKLLRETKI